MKDLSFVNVTITLDILGGYIQSRDDKVLTCMTKPKHDEQHEINVLRALCSNIAGVQIPKFCKDK